MSILQALSLVALLAEPTDGPGWKQVTRTDGITVFERENQRAPVPEVKAIGLIEAPPPEVWKVITDYDNYKTTMPYTAESKILSKDGKDTTFYSVIDAPLVSKRDYVIKLTDESDWKEGKGYFKLIWTNTDQGPGPKDGLVRVKLNDGFWKLEPRENGAKTFVTYYNFTDPGGSIPGFVKNQATKSAVPDVIKHVRKAVAAAKK
jgi:hypothetical protein